MVESHSTIPALSLKYRKLFRGYFQKGVIVLFAIAPYGYIISLSGFYFHAKEKLGWYPTYGNPDPKELDTYHGYAQWIDTTMEIWFYSLLVGIAIYMININVHKGVNRVLFIMGLIGNVIAILITFSGIFEWYVD